MVIDDLMKHLHEWLSEEHFVNKIYKEEDVPPFITALLGQDRAERERTLKIRPLLQDTGEMLKSSKEPKNLIVALEFTVELPFSIDPKSEKEVASLLHYLNGELYLPGFHLDEAHEKVYFRHINYSLITGIDKKVLIGLVGLILLYIDLYMKVIEEVASLKKTFNDVIEEVVAGA